MLEATRECKPNNLSYLPGEPHPADSLELLITLKSSRLARVFQWAIWFWLFISFGLMLGRWVWVQSSFNALIVLFLSLGLLALYSAKRLYHFQQKSTTESLRLLIFSSKWMIETKGSRSSRQVQLSGQILSWQWLAIIPVRDLLTKRERHIVIWKDAVTTEEWRKLKVWIKHTFSAVG